LSFDGRDYRKADKNTVCFVGRDLAILKMARDEIRVPNHREIAEAAHMGGFVLGEFPSRLQKRSVDGTPG
jgi:hypothetical protein